MLDALPTLPHPGAALVGLALGIPTGGFLGKVAERFSYDDEDFDSARGPREKDHVTLAEIEDTSRLPWWERIPLFGLFVGMASACRFELLVPPSRCNDCHAELAWSEMVPIWSFLALGGRCSHCGARIPRHLFWIELLTPLVLLVFLGVHGLTAQGLLLSLLAAACIVASTVDQIHQIIPDEVSLAALVVGLGAATARTAASLDWGALGGRSVGEVLRSPAFMADGHLGLALAGAFAGALVLWILLKLGTWIAGTDAMGCGDIKLSAAIGTFLGPKGNLVSLFFAALFGAAVGVVVLLRGGGRREGGYTKFAFGPHLALGAAVIALAGADPAIEAYLGANDVLIQAWLDWRAD